MDAELYKSGFFSFDDLWEIYKNDFSVKLMNGITPV